VSAVVLRRFTLADVSKLFVMSQQAGLRTWIPDQVYADEQRASEVLAYLIAQYDQPDPARRAPLVLGVCLGDELVGHVGLSAIPDGVEIGYAIADGHQGKGFATEAVAAMTAWGFDRLALPAIDGIVAPDNAGSCRVLEKAGFVMVSEAMRPMHGVTQLVRTYRKTQGSRT
jgi:ribosomal-protein-alanine N-acetyltransferase